MSEYRFNLGDRKHQIHGLFIFLILVFFMFYEEALGTSIRILKEQVFFGVRFDINVVDFQKNFPFFIYIVLQIPIGLLYDRFSSRRVIPLGILFCSAGSIILAWASHEAFISIARLLIAIGAPFAFLGVVIMVTRWFPSHRFGVLAGFGLFAGAVGLVLASLSIEALVKYYFSWGAVMIMLGSFGIVLALMAFMVVWDNPLERMQVPPKVQYYRQFWEIFRSPQTYWTGLFAFCGWGALIAFSAISGADFLQVRYGISQNESAVRMAILWAGFAVMSPIIGYISQKVGRRVWVIRFTSLLGLIFSILFLYLPNKSIDLATFFLFCIGGASGGHILSYALVKERTYLTSVGIAFGFNNFATQFGGLFALIVTNMAFALFEPTPQGLYTIITYRFALFIVPFFYALAWIISLFFLKETYCEQKVEGDMI